MISYPKDLSPRHSLQDISPNLRWRPKKWGIVGASGFIGSAICEELERMNYEVVRISAPRLSFDPIERSPEKIAIHAIELSASLDLERRFEGCDVVVNAAGLATPDGDQQADLYGANAVLPAVLMEASRSSGVGRFIHLSSAAVQGNREYLNDKTEYAPFSEYSYSKTLGELAIFELSAERKPSTDVVVIRATSVQGEGRRTTQNLRKFSSSIFASVASPGTQPSVVSSILGLVSFVVAVGNEQDSMGAILLQPWERINVTEVIKAAGGREPIVLPRAICRSILRFGYSLSKFIPRISGAVRRVEMVWFGQGQDSSQYFDFFHDSSLVIRTLQEAPNSAKTKF